MNVLTRLLPAFCLLTSVLPTHAAEAPAVRRLQAGLDALIATDARLETLHEADTVFDGPTWVRRGGAGYLVFSDVPGDVIDRLQPDGSVTAVVDHVFTGQDRSEAYQSFGVGGQKQFWMVGANGTTLDRRGRIVYCAYSNGQIVRLESDGQRTVLASRFGANRLNAPNDLAYRTDGSLWFTDSRAATKHADGEGAPSKALYRLAGAEVQLVSKDIDHPNGLAFSPDQKYLYIANTRLKTILRFEAGERSLAHEVVLADMNGDATVGAPDGIKVDRRGDIYCTGPGGVWILSASGEHLGTVLTPKQATNLAFGDRDGKTLYVTAFGAVYRIRLKVAGR